MNAVASPAVRELLIRMDFLRLREEISTSTMMPADSLTLAGSTAWYSDFCSSALRVMFSMLIHSIRSAGELARNRYSRSGVTILNSHADDTDAPSLAPA